MSRIPTVTVPFAAVVLAMLSGVLLAAHPLQLTTGSPWPCSPARPGRA